MKLKDKSILVYGAGISGISALKLLLELGASPILFDGNTQLNIDEIKIKHNINKDFKLLLGELEKEALDHVDLVVISPGVATDIPDISMIKERKIPLWGEIELAYIQDKGQIIGITGTNGKTTTTALVGEILKRHFEEIFVVGNIGLPYTYIVRETSKESVTVVELSSFQLESIMNFKPKTAAILNISPDHLNRHHTMKAYIDAKKNIFRNQNEEDFIVLNYEDEELRKMENKIKSNIIYFSSKTALDRGIYLEDNNIIYNNGETKTKVCNTDELGVLGSHNYENIMAGVAISLSLGVPLGIIVESIKAFKAVEHRIEYVGNFKGVDFYNDSKGTNTDASQKAIEAMKKPTILIAGGYDKDGEFNSWIKSFKGKVKHLILLGQTKEKIKEASIKEGFTNISMVNDLEEAVVKAKDIAKSGEAVLLSPACASWGMFKNYEERGNLFKKYVKGII